MATPYARVHWQTAILPPAGSPKTGLCHPEGAGRIRTHVRMRTIMILRFARARCLLCGAKFFDNFPDARYLRQCVPSRRRAGGRDLFRPACRRKPAVHPPDDGAQLDIHGRARPGRRRHGRHRPGRRRPRGQPELRRTMAHRLAPGGGRRPEHRRHRHVAQGRPSRRAAGRRRRTPLRDESRRASPGRR